MRTYKCLIKIFLLCFILIIVQFTKAQTTNEFTLSEAEFISIITKFHPIIQQSNVAIEIAKSNLLSSRGAFDPNFNYSIDKKTFDGKNYYNYINPEIQIPTWYGVELKAGMEDNIGLNTNPEITKGVSSYLGIKVPLGKNLLLDNRRAALQQAKLFLGLSKVEKNLTINDLFTKALAAYWNWVREYNKLKIINQIIDVNEKRLQNVRIIFQQGDIPALDTIEALSQLQNFVLQKQDIELNLVKSIYELSNFLWLNNKAPFDLTSQVIPAEELMISIKNKIETPALNDILITTLTNHPKLNAFDYKLHVLSIDKKLSFQSLLPIVDIKANILNEGYYAWKGLSSSLIENNYKFGLDIKIPLRLSEGRGKYKAAQLKINDTELELQQMKLEIENKVKASYKEVIILKNQIEVARQNIENYKRLFKGEEIKFNIGESNLFILNIRENKMLDFQLKIIDLQTKYLIATVNLIGATGQLR